MPDLEQELLALQRRVAELTQRVYKLETAAGLAPSKPVAPPEAVAPSPPPSPVRPSVAAPPVEPPRFVADQAVTTADRDLESRIGTQWLNRIGMVALLIGAAYFLKLAFDNDWIGPSGRIAIGLLSGIGLVFWSTRLHARGYKYFAYSLTAVGIGIMYLSLWAAYQLYHLVPGSVAFAAMIMVTASAAALALRLEAQVLAVVALAGGFSTPILLSTGQNRPVELFTYLLLLDAFAIVLVTLRPWRRILSGAFFMTTVYYIGWYARFYHGDQRKIALAFATLFFALFVSLPLIRRVQLPISAGALDITHTRSKTLIAIALFNPIVYFGQLYALYDDQPQTMAWLAILLAAVYIALSRKLQDDLEALPHNQQFERFLHLALAIGFLTIAIPLRLEGYWITIGWLVESAVLLGVGHRFENAFLKNAAIAALALGLFRLLFIDDFHATRLLFNARFATYLIAIAVFGTIAWLLREEYGSKHKAFGIAILCLNVLVLWGLNLEVSDYFDRRMQSITSTVSGNPYQYDYQSWSAAKRARDFTYSALWMIYGAVALMVGFWKRFAFLRWQALVLIAITIAKVFLYDLSNLSGAWRVLSFIALGALLMAISFIYQKGWLNATSDEVE